MTRILIAFGLLSAVAWGQPSVPPIDTPTASAVITDGSGQPIADGTTFEVGETIVLSAKTSTHGSKARSVLWLIEPPERARHSPVSDDGLTLYVSPGAKPVEITVRLIVALTDEAATTAIRLKCGEGSRPPPGPVPDDDDDPVPTAAKLGIYVVHDSLNQLPDTSKILNALDTWNAFRASGHEALVYDLKTNETRGKKYVSECSGVSPPVLLIRDRLGDKKLVAIPLPKTLDGLNEAVRKLVKP